jgi:hypothetical protein
VRSARGKIQAQIEAIVRPRWVREVITVQLTDLPGGQFHLAYHTDQGARARLERRLFGKRVLFTNRDAWSCAEVITAYRSQSQVEAGFRQLKDTQSVSFSPLYHFTDHKIRIHVFYCVLALAIAHLMRRESERAGIPHSVNALMHELSAIQETVLLYHDGERGRPRAQRLLTDATPAQQQLADLFGIHAYAPTH